jgi:hypothetical protein
MANHLSAHQKMLILERAKIVGCGLILFPHGWTLNAPEQAWRRAEIAQHPTQVFTEMEHLFNT